MKKKNNPVGKKYQKHIGRGRKASADVDFSAIQMKDMARLFSVDVSTICKWECPRNKNGSYNAPEVLKWYTNRLESEPSDRTDLENEKLKLQCTKLQIEIDESKKNTVTVQYHREFLADRAADLKDYLMGYAKMNLNEIVMQSIEVIQKYWDKVVRAAMNTYVKNRS